MSFPLLLKQEEEVAGLSGAWSHIPGSCDKAITDPGVSFGSLAPGEPAGSREEFPLVQGHSVGAGASTQKGIFCSGSRTQNEITKFAVRGGQSRNENESGLELLSSVCSFLGNDEEVSLYLSHSDF